MNKITKGSRYRCDSCNEVFESNWTEEEADKEYKEEFKGFGDTEMAVVCDDCYKKILETTKEKSDYDMEKEIYSIIQGYGESVDSQGWEILALDEAVKKMLELIK